MGSFFARRAPGRVPGGASAAGRLRRAALAVSVALLSACASTDVLNTSGLDRIVEGRTTMEQASDYLGARPVDVWRQGDTTLARWAFKGSLATDAVYIRQEAWLRFGPDGTFQRMENAINLPLNRRPRTAAQADQEARAERQQAGREQAARPAAAAPLPVQAATAPAGETAGAAAVPLAVPAADAIQPASLTIPPPAAPAARTSGKSARTRAGQADAPKAGSANPLLPAGTRVIPGVTYPVRKDR